MTKEAHNSFGTKVQIGDGADPESFVDVAELMDIDGPGFGAETEDVTTHDSPNRWIEKIQTVKDGGQIAFDLLFLPGDSTHDHSTGLLKDFIDGTLRNFKVIFPVTSNNTWDVSAIVVGFSPTAPVKGALTASVTLEVSGEPSFSTT